MRRLFVVATVLFLLVILVMSAYAAETVIIRPLIVELRGNETVTIRCVAPVVDEIIISPQGEREVLVTCRTYVEGDE